MSQHIVTIQLILLMAYLQPAPGPTTRTTANDYAQLVASNCYARAMTFNYAYKAIVNVKINDKVIKCLLLTNEQGQQIACTTLRESVCGIRAHHIFYMGYRDIASKMYPEDIFGYPKFPCVMMKNGKEMTVYNTLDFNICEREGWVSKESLENSSPAA